MRIGVVIAALVLVLPGSVDAAFPGPNGRLAFTQWTIQRDRFDNPTAYLCSSAPDGSATAKLVPSRVGAPAFSPDGGRLAVVGGLVTTSGRLLVGNADGSGLRELYAGPNAGSPSWSADGREIFVTESGDLVVVSWPDGAARRLTSTSGRFELDPAASPDGTRLAYVISVAGAPGEVVVSALDGSSPRTIAVLPFPRSPDWAPDGGRIAFTADNRLWSVRPDGAELRDLGPGVDPVWSPDGTRIAFTHEQDIWTMAADGSDRRRVTETPASEHTAAWQPASAPIQATSAAPCAITGTHGDDVLEGTDGPDWFYDLGGDDVIRGLGGDDVIVDGGGNDTIDAGEGADLVNVRAGANTIRAGGGADTVQPWLPFTTSGQRIDGGPGNDSLTGGQGPDRVEGGEGDDSIVGLKGADVLFGGPGNDRIQGNRGDDSLDGGLGNDVLFGGLISGRPARYDGYDVLLGRGGNDRLAGGWQRDRLFGGPGNDRLRGGPHGDHLVGDAGADDIGGEAGDDLLLARDGSRDRVFGGPGFDRARLDAGDRRGGIERRLR